MPSWLSFDPATQTFSGTPGNDDVGNIAVRVTATDVAGASATQDFQVTVANSNDGPVASAVIVDRAATEDAGFTFAVPAGSFTDIDVGDHLTYTATLADGSALPSWLSFDPVTQTFSGTPGNDDVGDIAVRVTATDVAGASATQDFQVTVANSNDGPVASAVIADQAATEDAGFTFAVPANSFTDIDVGDHLTYTATLADGSALPSWLSFDPVTQTFSGTPGNDDVGDIAVRVTATDVAGASATQDFQVTVANSNDGPVASAVIADQAATEDAGFTFAVPANSFTDIDVGDHLTYTATLADGSALPSWLSFDPATQTFSGTPGNDDVGNIAVRVTATDVAGASATQDFQVTVANSNDGPVASAVIVDRAATEDAGFTFAVPAGSFTDIDVGDHLTYTATLADGSALPSWLSFDPATQTFSGTPGNDDVGNIAVRVTATDVAGASATQDFQVTVANSNDGPVASAVIVDQAATEDAGFTFAVPANSFTDIDVGDHLTYTATLADGSALPSWLSFDPATQTFSGTPGNDDVGNIAVRVTATDVAGASATQDFQVTVANSNDGPVASAVIVDRAATEDAGFTFAVPAGSFTDIDVGDHLTYTATLADGSALPSWLSFDPVTQTFSGTPGNDDVGDIAVRVTATDVAGASATQDFQVTVANSNDGPVASAVIADQAATEDAGFTFAVPANSFTDIDVGDHLTYTATLADGSALPSWLSFDPATQTFSGTPGNDDVGNIAVRVTATDVAGASATQDFQVTVANSNDGPVASAVIVDRAATEDAGFTFAVPAGSFTDIDVGDHLTYTATLADGSALPSWLSFDPVTQTFSGTPGNDDVGDIAVRVTATDVAGASATQDFQVTVANSNDGPVASAVIVDRAATEDAGFTFAVPAGSFTDIDVGDHLTYTATLADGSALPSWLSFDPATQTFSGTPGNDDVGNIAVRVTATDVAGASATQDFQVTVANSNDGPVASAVIVDRAATEDAGFTFAVPAGSFTDIDVGDHLTYSATLADGSALPSWLSFDPVTQTFSGTPGNDDVGDIAVRVTATDVAGASATQDFQVTVANSNDGPVASAVIADQAATEDAGFTFAVPANSFTDIDVGDHLTYTATLADGSALPSWLSFDPATQTFSGTPGNDDVGDIAVRVTATDVAGASATQDFQVTVANSNDGPVASAVIADQAATEDAGFTFAVPANSFTDIDVGDHLTYTATLADGSALPSWLSFDPATQTFSGTPGNDDVGNIAVRVTATDVAGASATQDFQVTVANSNDAPVITSSNGAAVLENVTGAVYQVTATDTDAGDTISYSLSGTDAALFNIDAATGAVTFKAAPDYDNPDDAGHDNVYNVTVNAHDGTATTSQDVAITVNNVNEGPSVTSAAATAFAENGTGTVYTATATDPDAGTTLNYSISGADAALFNIDAATGAVTFKSAPNYEAPADAGGNNIYDIKVTASDGTLSATQDVAITVTNMNEGPAISTSPVAPAISSAPISEITLHVSGDHYNGAPQMRVSVDGVVIGTYTVTADRGSGQWQDVTITGDFGAAGPNNVQVEYINDAWGGVGVGDRNLVIDKITVNGTVFEAENADYQVGTDVIQGYETMSWQGYMVFDTSGAAPGSGYSVAENSSGTVVVAQGTDPDAGTSLTYSLTGEDAALFNINSTTGEISFKSNPDYEAATDAGNNNVYHVVVTTSDGTHTASEKVAITVSNVNEGPSLTSGAAATFAENATGTVYAATATDPDAGTTLTYSISGADAALFNVNATTGVVTFKSAPNYEAPGDAGGNNVYDIKVTASDGTNSATKDVAITVSNVNEGPSVTSGAAATFAENATGTVYTATATDPDAGTTLTYSISGSDAALFNVDATTGVVTFKSAPNYEAPGDAGGNNVYDIKVTASDGTNSATKDVAITVTNVNEGPSLTSGAAATFAENATGTVYAATATDPDAGTTLTYSISGADAALFNVDATTGVVTFKSAPNYEAPGDAGGNNVYDIKVTASDGTLSSTKDVAITVSNVNEGPSVTSGASATFAENATGTVYTATATDPDAGTTLTYSISGADAALFNVNAATGAVTFKSAPNYEAPGDAGGNNVYDIKVTASDGTLSSTKDVAITVSNVNEGPSGITVSGPLSVQETVTSGGTMGTAYDPGSTQPVVATLSATDPDAAETFTYSLVGGATDLFTVQGNQIVVASGATLDHEAAPTRDVIVRATDSAGNVYDKTITIAISNYAGDFTSKDDSVQVQGTSEEDRITTGAGNDTIIGSGGADDISAGAGTDTVDYSGSESPVNVNLTEGRGDGGDATGDRYDGVENVTGSRGDDKLIGDDADNLLVGGAGADYIAGGKGNDTADYSASDAPVYVNLADGKVDGGDATGDVLDSIENIIGSRGDDTLIGDAGDNNLVGGRGADQLSGGDGIDTADYSASDEGVYVNLADGFGKGGDASDDKLDSIENIRGSAHDDTFVGSSANNAISGGNGSDTLILTGNYADYTITYDKDSDSYTLVDNRKGSPDGTDTVTQIENFQFADGSITVKEPDDLLNEAPTFTFPATPRQRHGKQSQA